MTEGGCHCGRVRFELAVPPTEVTRCNCSICTKLGSLWTYCRPEDFSITRGRDGLGDYRWGDKTIMIRFCPDCGCSVCWEAIPGAGAFADGRAPKVGVNARLIDGVKLDALKLREWDGAAR